MPTPPSYYPMPVQEDIRSLSTVRREKDRQTLNQSNPLTHHYLMTQSLSQDEDFKKNITEVIQTLNMIINDDELSLFPNSIIFEFNSAESLREDLKRFQEKFNFDKLYQGLCELQKMFLSIQHAIFLYDNFKAQLLGSLNNIDRVGYTIRLEDSVGYISTESIDKLQTREMLNLMKNALQTMASHSSSAVRMNQDLKYIEIQFMQLIRYSLETKVHCENALTLINEIKESWLKKDQISVLTTKEFDTYSTIFDEIITSIQERRKQIRSIRQPVRDLETEVIHNVINVKTLTTSIGSPAISKITITKRQGIYSSSCSSLTIQMKEVTQHWSPVQMKMKTIEIFNDSDDQLHFTILSNSPENSSTVFTIQPLTFVVNPQSISSIKVLLDSTVQEGKHSQEWQMKLLNHQLTIPLILRCEIRQFSIDINLPRYQTTNESTSTSPIQTYLMDFGVVALRSTSHLTQPFTITNPTSVDLRVKIRREGGATGRFEIENRNSNLLLLAYESRTLTIRWNIQDLIQDATCTYEIYFRKDFKYRIFCVGKTRRITYELIYRSQVLTGKEYTTELEACLPNTILSEEFIVRNTGEIQMVLETQTDPDSSTIVTHLSHSNALLDPGRSLPLQIQFHIKSIHQSLINTIELHFVHGIQNPRFKLKFKTTAGWPKLDFALLQSLTKLEVEENKEQIIDNITLYNKGPVPMIIDHIHATSAYLTIPEEVRLPLKILPYKKFDCPYIYEVQKKLVSFDCNLILEGNFEETFIRIPFHCKRMVPIISFDPPFLHCGTTTAGSKLGPFSIVIRNTGNISGQINPEETKNNTFDFNIPNCDRNVVVSPGNSRTIVYFIEIKENAMNGVFRIDIPFLTRFSTYTIQSNRLIITGRIKSIEELSTRTHLINLPTSWQHLNNSKIEQRFKALLEDNTKPYSQRAATAISPIIITLNALIYTDPNQPNTIYLQLVSRF
ncbi:hypothetical protein I4U23_013708 [Adineta vaga]|nr:hypothetical protein I4U23_013708 [Adineta vaga]